MQEHSGAAEAEPDTAIPTRMRSRDTSKLTEGRGKQSRKAAHLDGGMHGSFTKHTPQVHDFHLPPA